MQLNRFFQKINAVLSLSPDIFLLQDIRIGKQSNVLIRYLRNNQFGNFKVIINSNKSSRGVLIGFKLDLDINIVDQFLDIEQNILLLKCSLNNTLITIGSIYGPLQKDNSNFMDEVFPQISKFNTEHFIVGGGFQCSYQ